MQRPVQIARRIAQIVPDGDDGWGVHYRASAMARSGLRVLRLSVGEHDIKTDPEILAAMDRAARDGATGYPPVPGIPELRDAVAHRIAERTGVETTHGNVLIVPGGQAGLFAAHLCVLEPGQTGLITDPYYATYPGTVRAAGGIVRRITTRPATGFAPDPGDILEAVQETGAASLLINSPNNPTGAVFDAATLRGIAEVCQETGVWLISDEVYDGQVWDGAHLSPRRFDDMEDRTLVVGSMSKSFAMTGSRLGWVVGPKRAIAALADLATHTTYGVPGFIQEAALWALTEGGDALEARVASPFRRRRGLVDRVLGASPAVVVQPMQGGMYAFVDIRATGMSGVAFAEALLDEAQVAVMPGESFGVAGKGHIRIAMTAADDVMEDALHRIADFAMARAADAGAVA